MSEKTTEPKVIGLSRDQRTQRWLVECPSCGSKFTPATTYLSKQTFYCNTKKCGVKLFADYNAEPPFVRLAKDQTA